MAPEAHLLRQAGAVLGIEGRLEIPLEEALRALPRPIRGLMAGVALAVRGALPEETRSQLQAALAQRAQAKAWAALATALQRLLHGERAPQALTQGLQLDETDALSLALTLAAVEDDRVLAQLLQGLEG